jgi:hypothetical protein
LAAYIRLIENELLPGLVLGSDDPYDPIVVISRPDPWGVLGTGNYAAVFLHPDYSDWVVKVYGPGRPGIEEEVEVYRKLGSHPAYSECYHRGQGYLILRRLRGITLYDCLRRGIPIPRQAIEDVEAALEYAVSRGLFPHDVHGKNVMVLDNRGLVVDVSDFLKDECCEMWDDVRLAYDRYYRWPVTRIPVPDTILNLVRKMYRAWRKRRF